MLIENQCNNGQNSFSYATKINLHEPLPSKPNVDVIVSKNLICDRINHARAHISWPFLQISNFYIEKLNLKNKKAYFVSGDNLLR